MGNPAYNQGCKLNSPIDHRIEVIFGQEIQELLCPKISANSQQSIEVSFGPSSVLVEQAEKGDANSLYRFSALYEAGVGVTQSQDKALLLLQSAARKGHAHAQYLMGRHSLKGHPYQAFLWFQKAAKGGNLEAQHRMWEFYIQGRVVLQSNRKALSWIEKAATGGHVESWYCLGMCFNSGVGVNRSSRESFLWYKKAADKGHLAAQYQVSCYYSEGVEGVVEKSESESLVYLERAATGGHLDAQLDLGARYFYGSGVEQSYIHSFFWHQKAADQGSADAQYALAYFHAQGLGGVEVSDSESLIWLEKAAAQGHEGAKRDLEFRVAGMLLSQIARSPDKLSTQKGSNTKASLRHTALSILRERNQNRD